MTEADVFTGLSGLEKAGFANAAEEDGGENPLPGIILQVVHYAHGFIGDCARNTLPDDDTIPERMIFPLVALARSRYATSIGYELSDDRVREAKTAEAFLVKVASCEVKIEPLPGAATPSGEAAGESMETVETTSNRLTDESLRGL